MTNTQLVPVLSQATSAYHYFRGNPDKAYAIHEHFTDNSLISSQLKSLYYLSSDPVTSIQIQKRFCSRQNLIYQALLVAGFMLAPLLLWWAIAMLGFNSDGIAPHSLASDWMKSFHGHIPRHHLFSYLQNVGRQGLPRTVWLVTALLGMFAIGIAAPAPSNAKEGYEQLEVENRPEAEFLVRPGSPDSLD